MKEKDFDISLTMEEILSGDNLAELIPEDTLNSLGSYLKTQIEIDDSSRSEWLDRNDKWLELVTQVIEEKTYPWPGASNIKFPLIATAAVQFHARAHPALLGNNKPVGCKIIGKDLRGVKAQRGGRVSAFMSYQVLEDIPDWQDDMDRLLFIVPIIGSMYKKTYYSTAKKKICSEVIKPRDMIINYDAQSIEEARKTHRIWKYPNQIRSMQLRGIYKEFEGSDTVEPVKTKSSTEDAITGRSNPGAGDDYALQELFETHCLLDLDGDGYQEPYVITLRASDGKVHRIVPNYFEEDVEYIEDQVVEITPKEYFTHYYFLPDPNSKTHGIGFGTMTGPINEAVNTIINQLSDAGHLSNLQGGFLSRGVRLRGGAVKFRPGEWKPVDSTGDDLRKGIYPMPVREPSNVLFQLLGLLIDSGKDLSSVQDIMVGRNPGQNQPYRTSIEVIEQGMKVFNGIYKRLYRSMTSEFKKIYYLNGAYPDIEKYMNVLDLDGQEASQAALAPDLKTGEPMGVEKVMAFLLADFESSDIDIVPSAEPDMLHEMQKAVKGRSLLEKLAGGIRLNVQEVTRRVLESEGHEDIETLMKVPEAKPPPEFQLEVRRQEHLEKMDNLKVTLEKLKTESDVLKNELEGQLLLAKAGSMKVDGIHNQFIKQQELNRKEFEAVTSRLKAVADASKTYNDNSREHASRASGESK